MMTMLRAVALPLLAFAGVAVLTAASGCVCSGAVPVFGVTVFEVVGPLDSPLVGGTVTMSGPATDDRDVTHVETVVVEWEEDGRRFRALYASD